uniref:Uncharacterized protein n=1 Tax=Globisporangium ultimum (strain ATCC 200006 / CBS 805.95 / DAOM BR144) TaxID=431595 RepID=K3WJ97_GLOUD
MKSLQLGIAGSAKQFLLTAPTSQTLLVGESELTRSKCKRLVNCSVSDRTKNQQTKPVNHAGRP